MIELLNDYDWKQAFGFAGETGAWNSGMPSPAPPNDEAVPVDPFTREDVEEIVLLAEGENDGDPWFGVFVLKDRRFASIVAGCDYTGWDCQAGGDAKVAATLDSILRYGLTDSERRRVLGGSDGIAVAFPEAVEAIRQIMGADAEIS